MSTRSKTDDSSMNGGGIAMIGFGEASFSLADAQIPCVPSTAILMQQVDTDVEMQGLHGKLVKKEIDPINKQITMVVTTVAVLALLFGMTAMWIEASLVAYVAFFFPMVTAPYVIYQRQKIQRLPSFREVHNVMRHEVCRMAMQRNVLENENSRLERQVSRLSGIEGRLEQILQRDGKDVAFVKNLIFQNGATLREMHKLQMAIEMQNLFSVVLQSDKNEDNTMSEAELDEFMIRMKQFASTRKTGGRQQLTFDEGKVREAFSKSLTKTMQSLINVTASMMEEEHKSAEEKQERVTMDHKSKSPVIAVETVPDDETSTVVDQASGTAMNPVDVTDLENME